MNILWSFRSQKCNFHTILSKFVPSVSPNNLEHLEGSPLYVISGALEVATAAGGCLKKSEGRDEGGGNEGDAGAGDPPANCLGGGIGGGVGLGVVSAVVATGGVQTVF